MSVTKANAKTTPKKRAGVLDYSQQKRATLAKEEFQNVKDKARFVNLSRNNLRSIAALQHYSHADNITILDISNNHLSQIDALPTNLKVLNFSDNKIVRVALPSSLEIVHCNSNLIDDVSLFRGLDGLRELHMDGNRLRGFSVAAAAPSSASASSSSSSASLPPPLVTLPALQILSCNENKIECIKNLNVIAPGLQVLKLRHNLLSGPLKHVPTKKIECINVDHNTISGFDFSCFSRCAQLKMLCCDNNPSLESFSGLQRCAKLEIVRCRNSGVRSFQFLPPSVKHLDLSNNKIDSWKFVPTKNLTYVDISKNGICSLQGMSQKVQTLYTFNCPGLRSYKYLPENIVNLNNFPKSKLNEIKEQSGTEKLRVLLKLFVKSKTERNLFSHLTVRLFNLIEDYY